MKGKLINKENNFEVKYLEKQICMFKTCKMFVKLPYCAFRLTIPGEISDWGYLILNLIVINLLC